MSNQSTTFSSPLQDVVFHVVWVFFWFVASVDFAVQYNSLYDATHSILTQNCLERISAAPSYSSAAQAGIAVVGVLYNSYCSYSKLSE